ncbi:hypothetical protein [Streptomyces sp. NPDC050355]|uniref:Uncharacterized protein n=1 Tax=Streptomyces sirii TaxID=3127701 RepID=A0ABZ2QTX7_9ACTN
MAAGECPHSLADLPADDPAGAPAGVRRPIRRRSRSGRLRREEVAGP